MSFAQYQAVLLGGYGVDNLLLRKQDLMQMQAPGQRLCPRHQ